MSLKTFLEDIYAKRLIKSLKHKPSHIAVIQDGNRRYAKIHSLPIKEGHELGADNTLRVISWMGDLGIKHLTFYAFSTENFKRSAKEVSDLLNLFIDRFTTMLSDERLEKNGINVTIIGDRSLIPDDVLDAIERLEDATKNYNKCFIHFAIAYGGRNEIVETTKRIVESVQKGEISASEITNECVTKNMYPDNPIPPVDLIIRTANDKRTSNFLPWLANGNEAAVYFCAPTWPEFRYVDIVRALRVYDQRAGGD